MSPSRGTGSHIAPLVLRVAAVVGLAVDAYVHLHLASTYDPIGSTITQGQLFRVEAVLAILALLALALRDNVLTWAAAGLVASAGLLAVLVTRYVDVPSLGPIPAMHEPLWYPEKVRVTVAMAVVSVAWLLREMLRHRRVTSRAAEPARTKG